MTIYRQDVYEIPPDAIRELIINAAVHIEVNPFCWTKQKSNERGYFYVWKKMYSNELKLELVHFLATPKLSKVM